MARVGVVISNWCKLIENLQASPMGFYAGVEDAVGKRQVPETTTSRVDMWEGGMFSAKREYLRITRKRLVFDICAAPFGTGFFVSSWLGSLRTGLGIWILLGTIVASALLVFSLIQILGWLVAPLVCLVAVPTVLLIFGCAISEGVIGGEDAILETPILGFIYDKIFHPITYYKIDTAQMFQTAIHAAVLEVIDEITKAKGLRALTELERKPVMKEFVKR